MNKIRTLIVDDESLARRGLRIRLQTFDNVEIIGECKNGREALEAVASEAPDLLFLDIQMPGLSGFDVVRMLPKEKMPLIIFATAFDQYAIDAFEVHAVDYVLKPIEEERLAIAIERAVVHINQSESDNHRQRLMDLITNITGQTSAEIDGILAGDSPVNSPYPEKIAIKDRGETSLVVSQDIGWIEAAGDYMCIHVGETVHVLRSTMKELETKLNPQIFQRVHRSTIVNLEQINKVCSHINGEYYLILKSGSRIKMSRSYRDKIKHII